MATWPYKVDSTAITSLEYDDEESTVVVSFAKGGSYTLKGVSHDTLIAWLDAPSKGGYWNANMKGKY